MLCIALLFPCARTYAATANVDWPTYGAAYNNGRYIALDSLSARNVSRLHRIWRFVLGPHERVETTPIVVDGTMYATTGVANTVVALDAATGRLKWRYRPALGAMSPCCGALNRGVAVGHNRVYYATLDARLIALDDVDGKRVWDVRIGDGSKGLSETMAPLYWDGVVFVGSSGGDYGIRGSLSAYRASDGTLLWRWYAVSPGWEGAYRTAVNGIALHRDIAQEKKSDAKYSGAWRHGGGAVWMTPALDPIRGVVYASTGNPSPVFDGELRPGDNLYTDSVVAIDARSGKLLWGYQQTPHDVWEYEAASPPVLLEALDGNGKRIPVVAEAGKTRWLYILDRRNGKLVRLSQSWSANADVYQPYARALDHPKSQLPLRGTIGPISYHPGVNLAYVAEIDRPDPNAWRDLLVAIAPSTGRIAWKKQLGRTHDEYRGDPVLAGALSVSDLVFASDPDGELTALDARTGETLWKHQLGSAAPVDGRENVFQRLAHRVRDILLPIKRAMFRQDPPTQALAGVDTSPIAYQIHNRPYVAIGYDAQPERATGAAVITAFSF